MTKKIIVSGCANCPYLTVWNDGKGNSYDSICSGSCNHPSFNKELLTPHMCPTVFFQYSIETVGSDERQGEVVETKPGVTPTWCPLPDNN
jgi:hypothetical protein